MSDADDDTGTGNILRCPALGPLRQRIDFVAERRDFRRCGFWRVLAVPGRDPGISNKRIIGRGQPVDFGLGRFESGGCISG